MRARYRLSVPHYQPGKDIAECEAEGPSTGFAIRIGGSPVRSCIPEATAHTGPPTQRMAVPILHWLIMPFQCGEDSFEVQVCLRSATAAPGPRRCEHLMSGEALSTKLGKTSHPTAELSRLTRWAASGNTGTTSEIVLRLRRNPAGETNECRSRFSGPSVGLRWLPHVSNFKHHYKCHGHTRRELRGGELVGHTNASVTMRCLNEPAAEPAGD